MRGSKETYEDMIGRHNSLENHFKMLEEEYFMECSRCNEKEHQDFIHINGLCENCNDEMNG